MFDKKAWANNPPRLLLYFKCADSDFENHSLSRILKRAIDQESLDVPGLRVSHVG